MKRRLAAFVSRLHISSAEPIALMTDGAESLLRLKALLPIRTRFVLDYFHVSMKLRHIDQCIGVIPPTALSPDGSIFELYDRFNYLRGYLWSGQRAKFEQSVDRSNYLMRQKSGCRTWNERSAWQAVTYAIWVRTFVRMTPG